MQKEKGKVDCCLFYTRYKERQNDQSGLAPCPSFPRKPLTDKKQRTKLIGQMVEIT